MRRVCILCIIKRTRVNIIYALVEGERGWNGMTKSKRDTGESLEGWVDGGRRSHCRHTHHVSLSRVNHACYNIIETHLLHVAMVITERERERVRADYSNATKPTRLTPPMRAVGHDVNNSTCKTFNLYIYIYYYTRGVYTASAKFALRTFSE